MCTNRVGNSDVNEIFTDRKQYLNAKKENLMHLPVVKKKINGLTCEKIHNLLNPSWNRGGTSYLKWLEQEVIKGLKIVIL